MPTEQEGPSTIWHALKEHRLEDANFVTYQPMRQMTASVLGVEPSFYPLACTSKAAIHTHVGLFGRSFHMPLVDMRLSNMTPALRRTAFLCSSVTFDCSYCTAHACAVGDVFYGPMERQIQRGSCSPVDSLDPNDPRLTVAERTVIRLAIASSSRRLLPTAHALSPLKDAVAKELGTAGLEAVMATIFFTGCLNTFMDVLGAELEGGVGRFANAHLATAGIPYEAGIHKTTEISRPPEGQYSQGRLSGILANGLRLLRDMPSFARGMMLERSLYVGIPVSHEDLNTWVLERLGYVPVFFKNIAGIEFKRAVCFGLRENLYPDGNENGNEARVWRPDERCALMYTYGNEVGCHELMELADGLKRSVSLANLKDFATGIREEMWDEACWDARQVVVDQAVKAENVSRTTIIRVMRSCEAEEIVELVGLLSFWCFWYRLNRLFETPASSAEE